MIELNVVSMTPGAVPARDSAPDRFNQIRQCMGGSQMTRAHTMTLGRVVLPRVFVGLL